MAARGDDAGRDEARSKRLSWLLRHGAREAGLAMDAAGWVAVDAVLRALALDAPRLEALVLANGKQRFELRGGRLRAAQGHSMAGTPVTREALEASWTRWEGTSLVWHGTSVAAAHSIAADGAIHPGDRTHVHLAAGVDSVVGKRAGVDVLLGVCPERLRGAGLALFESDNGVLLARTIPSRCVVAVRAARTRARDELAALYSRFGIGAAEAPRLAPP